MSTAQPKRFGNRPVSRLVGTGLFVLVAAWCFDGSGFSITQLLGSSEYLLRFLNEAFPPINDHRLTYDQFYRYWLALVETFQMAFAGTILGIFIGGRLETYLDISQSQRMMKIGLILKFNL